MNEASGTEAEKHAIALAYFPTDNSSTLDVGLFLLTMNASGGNGIEGLNSRYGRGMIVKRVCFGSDCFRPFAGISGVIGSVAFATCALTAGGDETRS